MATNNNLFAPPRTRAAGPPDAPKKARGAARWMRVLGGFFLMFGASVLGMYFIAAFAAHSLVLFINLWIA